ncbi:MAG: hypothetical protein STHCBS139747_001669 [Sporothrix thermara]
MASGGPSGGPAAAADETALSCPCPQCGTAVPLTGEADALLRQARQQIQALEAQIVLLDQKAATAIDRWADYEDELMVLRKKLANAGGNSSSSSSNNISNINNNNINSPNSGNTITAPMTPVSPMRTSFLPAGAANRLSALLSPRSAKSTPNLKAAAAASAAASAATSAATSAPPAGTTAMPPPSISHGAASSPPRTPARSSFLFFGRAAAAAAATTATTTTTQAPSHLPPHTPAPTPNPAYDPDTPSIKELRDALTREQKLRRQAEGQLQDTSREVEELSVSLFEQANEMVAEERRARARLEARVAVLEQRDTDKKRRLERLEQAMVRIERLRAMLGVGGDDFPATGATASPVRMMAQDEASLREKRSVSANA